MSTPVVNFTCDAEGCRSTLQLDPVDARDRAKALRKWGWTEVKCGDGTLKHFCLPHVFQGVESVPDEPGCETVPCGGD